MSSPLDELAFPASSEPQEPVPFGPPAPKEQPPLGGFYDPRLIGPKTVEPPIEPTALEKVRRATAINEQQLAYLRSKQDSAIAKLLGEHSPQAEQFRAAVDHASRLGVTIDQAFEDPRVAEQLAREEELRAIKWSAQYPHLASALQDPEILRSTSDDVAFLLRDDGWWSRTWQYFTSAYTNMGTATIGVSRMASEKGDTTPEEEMQLAAAKRQEILLQRNDGAWQWIMNQAGRMTYQLPVSIGAGYAGAQAGGLAGPYGAAIGGVAGWATSVFGMTATETAGAMYNRLRAAGVSHQDAREAAVWDGVGAGAVEAVAEMVTFKLGKGFVSSMLKKGAKETFSDLTKKGIGATFRNALGQEIASEEFAEISQLVIEEMTTGMAEDASKLELGSWDDIGEKFYRTITQTLVVAGVFGAVPAGMHARHVANQRRQAIRSGELLEEMGKNDKASKLIQSGTGAERYLATQAKRSGTEHLYVTKGELRTSLETHAANTVPGWDKMAAHEKEGVIAKAMADLEQRLPGVTAQVEAAPTDQTDIELSLVQYRASKLSSTDFHQTFLKHLRFSQEAVSLHRAAELHPLVQNLTDTIRASVAAANGAIKPDASRKDVEDAILAELNKVPDENFPVQAGATAQEQRRYIARTVGTVLANLANLATDGTTAQQGEGKALTPIEALQAMFGGQMLGAQYTPELRIQTPDGKVRGSYLGEAAVLSDEQKASLVQAKELQGTQPPTQALSEDILGKTGWFMGPDGKWRTPVAEGKIALAPHIQEKVDALAPGDKLETTIGEAFQGSVAVAAYPRLADVQLTLVKAADLKGVAAGRILLGDHPRMELATEQPQLASVFAHEAQHLIQGIEGFAPGGNSEWFAALAYTIAMQEVEIKLHQEKLSESWESLSSAEIAATAAKVKALKAGLDKLRAMRKRRSQLAKTVRAESPDLTDEDVWLEASWRMYMDLTGEVEARDAGDQALRAASEVGPLGAVLPAILARAWEELITTAFDFGQSTATQASAAAPALTAAERKANLDAWVKGSVVVDEKGQPLPVFHGTNTPGFSIFAYTRGLPIYSGRAVHGAGIYFSRAPDMAAVYAEGGAIYPVYLRILNPFIRGVTPWGENMIAAVREHYLSKGYAADRAESMAKYLRETPKGWPGELTPDTIQAMLKADGYDGLIYADTIYVVFDPSQIKSATGNDGTFDLDDPDIRSSADQAGNILRAAYEIERLLMVFTKHTQARDVFHELGHFWFNSLIRLASHPQASAKIKQEATRLLNALGVPSIEAYQQLSEKEKGDIDERWAYTVESVLGEGVAPEPALEGVFAKLAKVVKGILVSVRDTVNAVYKALYGRDLPSLTPELRERVNLMIVSEKQLQAAKMQRLLSPLFQTRDQFSGTDEEWETLQIVQEEAEQLAYLKYYQSSLRNSAAFRRAKAAAERQIDKQLAGVRKELLAKERKALARELVWRTLAAIERGADLDPTTGDERSPLSEKPLLLDRESLRQAVTPRNAPWATDEELDKRFGGLIASRKGGIAVEDIAELFGWTSPAAMLHALENRGDFDSILNERVDAALKSQHPELTDPERRDAQIDAAIHNDAREMFVAMELSHLLMGLQMAGDTLRDEQGTTHAQLVARAGQVDEIIAGLEAQVAVMRAGSRNTKRIKSIQGQIKDIRDRIEALTDTTETREAVYAVQLKIDLARKEMQDLKDDIARDREVGEIRAKIREERKVRRGDRQEDLAALRESDRKISEWVQNRKLLRDPTQQEIEEAIPASKRKMHKPETIAAAAEKLKRRRLRYLKRKRRDNKNLRASLKGLIEEERQRVLPIRERLAAGDMASRGRVAALKATEAQLSAPATKAEALAKKRAQIASYAAEIKAIREAADTSGEVTALRKEQKELEASIKTLRESEKKQIEALRVSPEYLAAQAALSEATKERAEVHRKLHGPITTPRELLAAARAAARAALDDAPIAEFRPQPRDPTKLPDPSKGISVKPKQRGSLSDRHGRAAAQAAKDGLREMKRGARAEKGEPEGTQEKLDVTRRLRVLHHKQEQLLHEATAAEAAKAEAEIASGLRRIKAIADTDRKGTKNHEFDYIYLAKVLVGQLEEHKDSMLSTGIDEELRSRALGRLAMEDPALYQRVEAVLARGKRPLATHTLREFRELVDILKNLRNISSVMYRARMGIAGASLDEVAKEVADRLAPLEHVQSVGGRKTVEEARKHGWRGLLFGGRRLEHWLLSVEGQNGYIQRHLLRPILKAVYAARTQSRDLRKQLFAMMQALPLDRHSIKSEKLNYEFGRDGRSGTLELLIVMLNIGNASNYSRLLINNKWADVDENGEVIYDEVTGLPQDTRFKEAINELIKAGHLTAEHFHFLNAAWEMLHSVFVQAQRTHIEVTGTAIKFLPHTKSVWRMQDGTQIELQGGYVPVRYSNVGPVVDTEEEAMAAKLTDVGHTLLPTVQNSWSKDRAQSFEAAMRFDEMVLFNHIDEVVRYAHVQGPLMRTMRVLGLTQRSVSTAKNAPGPIRLKALLKSIPGDPLSTLWQPWLQDVATQTTTKPSAVSGMLTATATFLRRNAAVNALFASFANVAQQVTGIAVGAAKIKRKGLLLQAIWNHFDKDQQQLRLTPMMQQRANMQFRDWELELRRFLINKGNLYTRATDWTAHNVYLFQARAQNFVDGVVWDAAYADYLEQHKAEKIDEEELIAAAKDHADSVVRVTQGSFDPENMSAWERGNAFTKLVTQFTSYFNMLANVNGSELERVLRESGWKGVLRKDFVLHFLWGWLVPVILSDAIAKAFYGDWPEETEDIPDVAFDTLLMSQVRSLGSAIPVVGQSAVALLGQLTPTTVDDRTRMPPVVDWLVRQAPGFVHSAKALVTGEGRGHDVATLTHNVGVLTGLPLKAIMGRPGSALWQIFEDGSDVRIYHPRSGAAGKVAETADLARFLVTGLPSTAQER